MCNMVYRAIIKDHNKTVLQDVRRIAGAFESKDWIPDSPESIMKNIVHTVYMGVKAHSSTETRKRAKDLAEAIGSYHLEADIDDAYQSFVGIQKAATGFSAKFSSDGGSAAENLALQNLQSRSRMVLAYNFSQLLSTTRGRPGGGGLLVLGSSNVDEGLRGYFTKYDNSSADVNPIGSISKIDLRKFIAWAKNEFKLDILQEFLDATPSAELIPSSGGSIQDDEVEMGLTYKELSVLGRLRKEQKLGPYSIFQKLLVEWKEDYTPRQVADKVKHFTWTYQINRHKQTTMTPSYHAESYSVDDNSL
jgi:NAD+ synthase (glutamine-hydrolysing)